jgi:23S rRNA (guanine2445-N2)-methyltransferase
MSVGGEKKFQYQKYNQYFGQAMTGTEELCASELEELGAREIRTTYRGVFFKAGHRTLYTIIYMSRLLMRVHAPLINFACHSTKYLTKTAKNIKWESLLSLEQDFAISASVAGSKIKHSLYASQCLKDGIADYFTEKYGKRPDVDVKNPDVRLNLHIDRDKAVISLDLCGDSLHKRGYRKATVLAPMQETLAAALVRTSGWQGDVPFWDCMCGSGTILCEALMHYCHIPPQYLRERFGFENMPDFDAGLWKEVRKENDSKIRSLPAGLIYGSDKSAKATRATLENLSILPNSKNVQLSTAQFQQSPNFENGVIVCNPPYGMRLSNEADVKVMIEELGNFLKRKCNGSSAYIYIGDPKIRKSIGLKPKRRIQIPNGPIKGELVQIDCY